MTLDDLDVAPEGGWPSGGKRDDSVEPETSRQVPPAQSLPPTQELPPLQSISAARDQRPTSPGPGAPGAVQSAPGYTSYPPAAHYPVVPFYASVPTYPPAGNTPGYWPFPGPAGVVYPAPAWPVSPIQFGPAPGLLWAEVGRRIGALAIDAVFMLVVLCIPTLLAVALGPHPGNEDLYTVAADVVFLVWVFVIVGYHPTCWWRFQRTIGQRLLGLRVVRAADGKPLGARATTVRFLIFTVCTLTVVPGLIAAALANESPAKRTWWDTAAGSVVVQRV